MSGFFALLDDIATLAKATVSTIDDVAAGAAKASAKTAGVIIDDTAVTPQYVQGIKPERELPIIGRIAKGSLRNKFLIILPVAFLLMWLAPAVLPLLLLLGGVYLCFEGAEKVLKHQSENAETVIENRSSKEYENQIVSSAIRTDLVLSAEIMLVAMSNIVGGTNISRILTLILVAFFMTFIVYGSVALLIKADDAGKFLTEHGKTHITEWVGQGTIKIMPSIFSILSVVGTAAMLWVGGHLIIENIHKLGFSLFFEILEHAQNIFSPPVVSWSIGMLISMIFGMIIGSLIVFISPVFRKIFKKLKHS